jgi:transcriptional regulator of acetoin/glycerol metabolism
MRPQTTAVPAAPPETAATRHGDLDDAQLTQLATSSNCTRKELARRAGLSERTLYRRLKRLGLA